MVWSGEPLLSDHFFPIIECLKEAGHKVAILTNGMLLNQENTALLKSLKPAFVQISLDGIQETHDYIRGEGSFEKAVNGIRLLKKADIKTSVSFTTTRHNHQDFFKVANLSKKLKVDYLWTDRAIPVGNGEDFCDSLSKVDLDQYFKQIEKHRKSILWKLFSNTEIGMNRALQFHAGGGRPYKCKAGKTLFAIMPDGTVYPCRRLPVAIGNIHNQSLADIAENPFIESIHQTPEACSKCLYEEHCNGGLKCLTYTQHESFKFADPGCLRA